MPRVQQETPFLHPLPIMAQKVRGTQNGVVPHVVAALLPPKQITWDWRVYLPSPCTHGVHTTFPLLLNLPWLHPYGTVCQKVRLHCIRSASRSTLGFAVAGLHLQGGLLGPRCIHGPLHTTSTLWTTEHTMGGHSDTLVPTGLGLTSDQKGVNSNVLLKVLPSKHRNIFFESKLLASRDACLRLCDADCSLVYSMLRIKAYNVV